MRPAKRPRIRNADLRVYRGPKTPHLLRADGCRSYVADWYEMFTDFELVPEEILDAGPECVIVVWHLTGTAKASGAPGDMRFAAVYTIWGGKIVRGREYMTKDDAFAAAANED